MKPWRGRARPGRKRGAVATGTGLSCVPEQGPADDGPSEVQRKTRAVSKIQSESLIFMCKLTYSYSQEDLFWRWKNAGFHFYNRLDGICMIREDVV